MGCGPACTNTVGSYKCGCIEGFTVSADGITCIGMCDKSIFCVEALSVSMQLRYTFAALANILVEGSSVFYLDLWPH